MRELTARFKARLPKFSIAILLTALLIFSSDCQLRLRDAKKENWHSFQCWCAFRYTMHWVKWFSFTCMSRHKKYWMMMYELVESSLISSKLAHWRRIHSGFNLFHLWKQEQKYTLCRGVSIWKDPSSRKSHSIQTYPRRRTRRFGDSVPRNGLIK